MNPEEFPSAVIGSYYSACKLKIYSRQQSLTQLRVSGDVRLTYISACEERRSQHLEKDFFIDDFSCASTVHSWVVLVPESSFTSANQIFDVVSIERWVGWGCWMGFFVWALIAQELMLFWSSCWCGASSWSQITFWMSKVINANDCEDDEQLSAAQPWDRSFMIPFHAH